MAELAPLRPRLHLMFHGPVPALRRLHADRQIIEAFGHEQNPYRWSFMHSRISNRDIPTGIANADQDARST